MTGYRRCLIISNVHKLRDQLRQIGRQESEVDWEKVRERDLIHFKQIRLDQVVGQRCGKLRHPLIFPAVLAYLALPVSNTFVECVFSACTWFDSPLRQRLNPKHFEIPVLLAANEVLPSGTIELPDEAAARRVVNEVLCVFVQGNPGFDATVDLGINANAESFMADPAEEVKLYFAQLQLSYLILGSYSYLFQVAGSYSC